MILLLSRHERLLYLRTFFSYGSLGHRLIKSDPDTDCRQFYRSKEFGVLLVIAGCDGSVMLDAIEEYPQAPSVRSVVTVWRVMLGSQSY